MTQTTKLRHGTIEFHKFIPSNGTKNLLYFPQAYGLSL